MEALFSNTTGNDNVAMGKHALFSNTDRSNLVAIGDSSLYHNGVGATASHQAIYNTAVGSKALFHNTIGSLNTALGNKALFTNISGSQNTSIGHLSLRNNSTGSRNVAIGSLVLRDNTTGADNTSIGSGSMLLNISGNENTAIGESALNRNISGNNNVGVGHRSMFLNSTGSANTAIGKRAMENNTTGSLNVAVGSYALFSNISGDNNTAVGNFAGSSALGSGNVFIGNRAGQNETGSNKLYIDNSDTSSPLIWGDFATSKLNFNGQVGINNTNPTSSLHVKQSSSNTGMILELPSNTDNWDVYIDLAQDYNFKYIGVLKAYIRDNDGVFVTVSDRRKKSNISPVTSVLPNLLQLQAARYHYNDDPSQSPTIGLITQDVELYFLEAVSEKDGIKGVNYQIFGVLAIEAIKEQQATIDAHEQKIELLESRLRALMTHLGIDPDEVK